LLFALGLHLTARWLCSTNGAQAGQSPTPAWSARSTAALLLAILVLFAAGTAMVGMVHQSAWLMTREASWYQRVPSSLHRAASNNHLKQIYLGVRNYYDSQGSLPTGGMFTPNGEGLHGWQTAILPYIGVSNQGIDPAQPWHEEANARLLRSPIRDYANPALRDGPYEDADGFALSHFAANRHLIGYDEPYRGPVEGDAGQTLLVGEINANFQPWASPRNVRDPLLGINRSPDGFGGPPNQKGAYFVLLDGSVRIISQDIDPDVLKAISLPSGDKRRIDAQ
jgi:hypothetical protein